MHKNHTFLIDLKRSIALLFQPGPQLCNNFKIYKAKVIQPSMYIYILKFFSNFQWKCPAWTCYYHQDPECFTNTFKDLTIIIVFTCYPHAFFNGFSLQKACRILLLVLYVSVWNSGLCYVGQCGEKWQVFPLKPCCTLYQVAQFKVNISFCPEWVYFHFQLSFQNTTHSGQEYNDLELNLSLMSLLI